MSSVKTREEMLGELLKCEKDNSRASLMFRSAIAGKFGLNVTDAECVDYLMDNGPTTAGRLAEITGLTNGAITSAIDRLEKNGFVIRKSDPRDRRKVLVEVVQEKTQQVSAYYLPAVQKIYALYTSFSDEELAVLIRFYHELEAIYTQGTHELKA